MLMQDDLRLFPSALLIMMFHCPDMHTATHPRALTDDEQSTDKQIRTPRPTTSTKRALQHEFSAAEEIILSTKPLGTVCVYTFETKNLLILGFFQDEDADKNQTDNVFAFSTNTEAGSSDKPPTKRLKPALDNKSSHLQLAN